ncbi:hypothetical protein OAG24_01135 [bacterium]|nr:hypothetical protein [bacterium]
MEYVNDHSLVASIRDVLKSLIFDGTGRLIGRLGNSEMAGIKYAEEEGRFSPNTIRILRIGPGVYSKNYADSEKEAESWAVKYMESITMCDAVTMPSIYLKNKTKIYPPTCVRIDIESFDPELLLPLLSGLKVLVVSPFEKTLRKQFKIKDKLFDFEYPDFELKIVKSFYSTKGNEPHSGWTETYEILSSAIQAEEFDVAILGCGGYGMPLASVIKKMGKVAICAGGFTVAYFGIKYKRIVEQNKERGWHEKYIHNENWIFPLEEDKPEMPLAIEGGCYF